MQQEVGVAAQQSVQLGLTRVLIRHTCTRVLIRNGGLSEKLLQALLRGGPRAPIAAVPHDRRAQLRAHLPQLMLAPCPAPNKHSSS